MALPKALCDREQYKFVETPSGEVAVRVEGTFTSIPSSSADTINTFNNVSSVASASLTTIVSYTVPVGKTLYLSEIEYSGENIARFDVLIDASLEARRRTWFTGGLANKFTFDQLRVAAGSVVELKVEHNRPETGDFEGRIVGLEV